jgi:hypothetical protein
LSSSATKISVILQELHGRVAIGHLSFDIIVRKILDVGYWWPMMNQNVYEYFQTSILKKM